MTRLLSLLVFFLSLCSSPVQAKQEGHCVNCSSGVWLPGGHAIGDIYYDSYTQYWDDGTDSNTWCIYVGADHVRCSYGGLLYDTMESTNLYSYIVAPTSDVAPASLSIHPANSYPLGAQTEAPLILHGGHGEYKITVTSYATGANDTYTVYINVVGSAVTRTEGVDWTAATSNAATACSIYDNLIASPISGMTPIRTDATCSDGVVGLKPDETTFMIRLIVTDAGGGGAFGTATSPAVGGQTLIGGPTGDGRAAPNLAFASNPNTGFYDYGSGTMGLALNGSRSALMNSTSIGWYMSAWTYDLGMTYTITNNYNFVVDGGGTGIASIKDIPLYVGDGTYAFTYSPKVGVEGIIESTSSIYASEFKSQRKSFEDDFTLFAPIYATLWDLTNTVSAGAGESNVIDVASGYSGHAKLITADNADDYESTWTQGAEWDRQVNPHAYARIRLMTDLADKEVRFGFSDTPGDGISGATDYVFIAYDESVHATQFYYVCSDTGGTGTMNTGPTANTEVKIGIEIASTGTAIFRVNGTITNTVANCIEADTDFYAFISHKTEGASNETLLVDSIQVYSD